MQFNGVYGHRVVGIVLHKLMDMNCWCFGRTVYYGQYQCTGVGANTAGRVSWSKDLTASEAQPFLYTSFVDGGSWIGKVWATIVPHCARCRRKIIMFPSKFAMCPSYIGRDLLSPVWNLRSDFGERWHRASALCGNSEWFLGPKASRDPKSLM